MIKQLFDDGLVRARARGRQRWPRRQHLLRAGPRAQLPAKTYVGVGGGILLQSLLQVIRIYDSASSAPRPRRVSASPAQRGAAPPCPCMGAGRGGAGRQHPRGGAAQPGPLRPRPRRRARAQRHGHHYTTCIVLVANQERRRHCTALHCTPTQCRKSLYFECKCLHGD